MVRNVNQLVKDGSGLGGKVPAPGCYFELAKENNFRSTSAWFRNHYLKFKPVDQRPGEYPEGPVEVEPPPPRIIPIICMPPANSAAESAISKWLRRTATTSREISRHHQIR
jgi:hypothetical protein